jgi:hypothetical protein
LPPVAIPWTKLPFAFDPVGLRVDLQSIPSQAWVPHFNPQDYSGEWSSVALRSRSGRADDITAQGAVEDFHDTPLAAQCPHLWAAVRAFAFPLKSVRLLRLHAGSRVREHCDRDLRLASGELRIHVPVATNEDVEFIVANRRLELCEGEAWYIDFSQPHRIDNRGAADRTHLVIDGTLNDWAVALLQRALSEVVTESFEPARAASLRLFREQVFEDKQLQTELLKITDREKFLDAVVAAGVEQGFDFELGEVESEFNRRRGEWLERSVGA